MSDKDFEVQRATKREAIVKIREGHHMFVVEET